MPMNRTDALATVGQVFREVFDDDSLELPETLVREDLAAWDSLGHIRLIGALEEAFGTTFTIEEIETMTSINRILDLVISKS